jgi:hypothetical protein
VEGCELLGRTTSHLLCAKHLGALDWESSDTNNVLDKEHAGIVLHALWQWFSGCKLAPSTTPKAAASPSMAVAFARYVPTVSSTAQGGGGVDGQTSVETVHTTQSSASPSPSPIPTPTPSASPPALSAGGMAARSTSGGVRSLAWTAAETGIGLLAVIDAFAAHFERHVWTLPLSTARSSCRADALLEALMWVGSLDPLPFVRSCFLTIVRRTPVRPLSGNFATAGAAAGAAAGVVPPGVAAATDGGAIPAVPVTPRSASLRPFSGRMLKSTSAPIAAPYCQLGMLRAVVHHAVVTLGGHYLTIAEVATTRRLATPAAAATGSRTDSDLASIASDSSDGVVDSAAFAGGISRWLLFPDVHSLPAPVASRFSLPEAVPALAQDHCAAVVLGAAQRMAVEICEVCCREVAAAAKLAQRYRDDAAVKRASIVSSHLWQRLDDAVSLLCDMWVCFPDTVRGTACCSVSCGAVRLTRSAWQRSRRLYSTPAQQRP